MSDVIGRLLRFWRWLTRPGCGPDCPHRGPGGEMCEECTALWAIK